MSLFLKLPFIAFLATTPSLAAELDQSPIIVQSCHCTGKLCTCLTANQTGVRIPQADLQPLFDLSHKSATGAALAPAPEPNQ